jgi:acetyltransferase-like isoleucine patch superfamily enzyme
VKLDARKLLQYARARLWDQTQWPDPDVIYRGSGMAGLVAFIHQTWDPRLTKELLVRYGADIHPDCWPIGPNITLHECPDGFGNLTIGSHVHIGKQVFLDLSNRLILEDSVSVGMRAILLTHLNMGHGYPNKPLARLFPQKKKPTILRRGCSIGAGAIVACGVEVGEDSVVNAGVVVDRDVPPRTVVNSSRQRANITIPDRFFAPKRADEPER